MSIRKREWTSPKGEKKSAWVVDYIDGQGKRRLKTFAKKKEADQFEATAKVEVREGIHVADSASVTVKRAASMWIASGISAGLERSSIDQRKRHVKYHIEPFIGGTMLNKLTIPVVRAFEDQLRDQGRSSAMIKKVLGSLGSILSDAQERGLATRNPVRDMRGTRRRGKEKQAERLHQGREGGGDNDAPFAAVAPETIDPPIASAHACKIRLACIGESLMRSLPAST